MYYYRIKKNDEVYFTLLVHYVSKRRKVDRYPFHLVAKTLSYCVPQLDHLSHIETSHLFYKQYLQ